MSRNFSRVSAIFAAVALAFAPALAFASPVPYLTGPLDTPRIDVNTTIQNINSSQAPAAYLQTYSGATPISATINGLRITATITGLTTAASTLSAAQTITDASVTAASQIFCATQLYAGTGVPVVVNVVPAVGSFTFAIQNVSTGAALNANVTVACIVYN